MLQESVRQSPSVRKLLMTPFMTGMTFLLILIGVSLYAQYLKHYGREVESHHDAVVKFYQQGIAEQQVTLGVLLETIAWDSRMLEALAERDAETLLDLYQKPFEAARDNYGVDYLLFVDPQRCAIARMHLPSNKNNDIIDRFTFLQAEQSGKTVAGLDADRSGKLSLRMVRPVYDRGVLLGYLEAAMEVDHILQSVVASQRTQLAFFLNKQVVEKSTLDINKQRQANEAGWIDINDEMLAYVTFKELDKNFAAKLLQEKNAFEAQKGEKYFTLTHNSLDYVANILPLTDSLGDPLGDLFILEDTTYLRTEYSAAAAGILCIGLLIIFVSRKLASGKLKKTDDLIAEMVSKVQESDVVFQNVFEESETGFVLQNWITGEVLKANRVALHSFGAETAEEINFSQMQPLPPDDELQTSWQASGSHAPLTAISTEKSVSYCEISQFFIGTNEEIQCIAIRDVTQVVNLQHQNRAQIEHLQTIIDQLPGMIFIKDSELRLTLYNSTFETIFGEGQSMLGKVYYADWLGSDIEKLLETDRVAFEVGEPVTFDSSITLRDGREYTYVVSKQVITEKDGSQYLLCVSTDISERSRMEKQLISLREKAEEASLAKSQFLARMSHEIRTPMNAILGMSHLAINASPEPRQLNYLTKIHGAAKNLLGIINDILDFSKIEAGEMSLEDIPFSLKELVQDIRSISAPLVSRKPVQLLLDIPEFTTDLLGDPLRMRQVLLNLVNNAIKFTSEGEVRIVCAIKEERAHEFVLNFAVEDTGIGIPEEAMHRLFTSFQQVDGSTTRKYGGTGLGLAISRQLVNLMGGDIAVHSTVGKGTTFSFTITLGKAEQVEDELLLPGVAAAWHGHEEENTAEPGSAPTPPRSLPSHARILVVEDNEINQEIIVELLQGFGVQVQAVNNGKEAVSAVEQANFELVLMDLQMPVMDGLEATRQIRILPDERGKNLPIIALTANAMTEDREMCLSVGMNDFLSKPIDVAELQEKLLHWLG